VPTMKGIHTDFAGTCVALATPFQSDGALDLAAFRHLVRHVVGGGANVLVALGSTGEAATLDDRERERVLVTCLEEAGGASVLAGTGTNDTARTAALTRQAQELGAHGALVVAPYYSKPMPRGVLAHYDAVAAAAPDFPLVAYNVPSRTGTNLSPALVAELWQRPQVVALKESSGNMMQIGEIAAHLVTGRVLLAGDDALALATIAVGGDGLVSVAGNLVPDRVSELVTLAREGRFAEARAAHKRLLPLFDALFAESNPIPLKAGLAALGLAGPTVRLPLTSAEESTRSRLVQALTVAGGSR
jgi:4-hydroxy-tetrahydrodipicolinate synthase